MSEIISDYERLPIGHREVADFDRLDTEGRIVTHRNVPFVVLREVTEADYRTQHPNAPRDRGPRFYYEISVD